MPGIVLDPETKMVDHTDSVSTVLGPTVQWESQDLEMAELFLTTLMTLLISCGFFDNCFFGKVCF